jgi:hypothetical protein
MTDRPLGIKKEMANEALEFIDSHLLPPGAWAQAEVQGVGIASGKQLAGHLQAGDARLRSEQVQALAREADRVLKPAVRRADRARLRFS